ncbi:MAG: 3,4-dihydroxy 2-butanone 4-phosphate synthase/GTP cyclohydrolase II [Halieaceae bacterium]|jgi:3,4-dihydroxy 2-butanone 4-phosphate synthase/GTP cyclohydrolase II
MQMNTTDELIVAVRRGEMVVLLDDDTESSNEGCVAIGAEHCSADHINFMARKARGLICLALTEARCRQLALPPMVEKGHGEKANFTLSIEATVGISTGISAADRARTVQAAVNQHAKAEDIVQPGHIFPLAVQPGGVLNRAGHTEAASDLARLAGLEPAAVIADIMNNNGELARLAELVEFAAEHKLKIGSIADLIQFRAVNERTVKLIRDGQVETDHGPFRLRAYRDSYAGDIHLALTRGDIKADQPTLVRVHVGSTVRDMFATQAAGRETWNIARCLQRVADEGLGAVVLLAGSESEDDILGGVDIALGNAVVASPVAGGRGVYLTVGLGSQILRDLGVGKIRLMGAPIKYNAISGFDLEVMEHVEAGHE